MASTNKICLLYKRKMLSDWEGNAKLMVLSGALFNTQTVEFINEISANEVVTGTAYTGPITLTGVDLANVVDDVDLDWSNIQIAQDAGGGFTNATHAAIYLDTGTPSTSPVMQIWDFDGTFNNQIGPVNLNTPNKVLRI